MKFRNLDSQLGFSGVELVAPVQKSDIVMTWPFVQIALRCILLYINCIISLQNYLTHLENQNEDTGRNGFPIIPEMLSVSFGNRLRKRMRYAIVNISFPFVSTFSVSILGTNRIQLIRRSSFTLSCVRRSFPIASWGGMALRYSAERAELNRARVCAVSPRSRHILECVQYLYYLRHGISKYMIIQFELLL